MRCLQEEAAADLRIAAAGALTKLSIGNMRRKDFMTVEVIPCVTTLTRHADSNIRCAALALLAPLGDVNRLTDDLGFTIVKCDKKDLRILVARLEDESAEVREAALAALGEVKDNRTTTVTALGKCLDDKSPEVQKQTVKTLARIHVARVPDIEKLLFLLKPLSMKHGCNG